MAEKYGNQEIKDVLKAAFAIAGFVIERSKDGIGVDDAVALVAKLQNDAEFSALLKKAFDEAGKLPEEVSDLSLAEGLDLIVALIPDVVALVGKFK